MAVKIVEVKRGSCPATRFIGKKYEGGADWGEWWENDWFTTLGANQCIPFNGDAYIGAVHIVNGMPEHWIGMFFPVNTEVPEGFEYVDIEPLDYLMNETNLPYEECSKAYDCYISLNQKSK